MIKPHTQTLDTLLETIHLFGDFLAVLVSWPIQIVYAWYKGLSFTFPWGSWATDEDLQSVSSDESRPQSRLKQRPQAHIRQRSTISNISTGSAQDPVDGFGAHQIWYPPPPAYEEEDRSQVRPPQIPVTSLAPGLYPTTRSPDEWREYPNFPAAYPLSPVLDSIPPPSFRIVAPVPQRPSDVIDIDNISNSGQDDGNESDDNQTRPGFRRSLLSSREFVNPNSVVRSSDEFPTHGVQLEGRLKSNKRKRKRMALEGGEEEHADWKEDGMNVDEKSGGENDTDADEEMDGGGSEDEGYADTTFTTPRVRTMAVDADAEMEDASGSEREDSFSFQTPLYPRRHGKRTKSNLTLKGVSPAATLNLRRNVQDARLKVYTASPPRPLPPHLAPQLSAIPSGSSVRSASTTLSTLGGGDSLMTGDASEREEIETPLSPEFPSPITYTTGASSEVSPSFPIPDVNPSLMAPGFVRNKRLFPRSYATSSRSRPPKQCMALTSSSSGGASSRSRASRKSQSLHPVERRKNASSPGSTRMDVGPITKGAENIPIPILVSDSEDARKASSANGETDARSVAPSLNKKQKISSASLRKATSSGSKTIPPPKRRLVAPQKPIRITRSTSSGTSASSSNVGARRKVGFVGSDKSAVRTTRVGDGGAGGANESGG